MKVMKLIEKLKNLKYRKAKGCSFLVLVHMNRRPDYKQSSYDTHKKKWNTRVNKKGMIRTIERHWRKKKRKM